jgi:cytoskeleton protein RodZ
MNIESFQDTLFEDPIGLRFRHAREKARWSLESAAQQLKLPVAVLDAIEREDWAKLGAPIFVRSYVGSYAKLLGLPSTLADEVVRGKPVPPLVSIGGSPAGKPSLSRHASGLGYLLLTVAVIAAVVALAMYYQSPGRSSAEVMTLDGAQAYATIAPSDVAAPAAGTAIQTEPALPTTPPPAAVAPAPESELAAAVPGVTEEVRLRFRSDSWVDLVNLSGTHIERGMVPAGSELRYQRGQLSHVTLGDADAVEVSLAGTPLDLAPFRDAKVARFTVSSDGRIARN